MTRSIIGVGHFGGMTIHILEEPTASWVQRSWRERLLSWPWRPWFGRRLQAGAYILPSCEAWMVKGVLYMYREQFETLSRFQREQPELFR